MAAVRNKPPQTIDVLGLEYTTPPVPSKTQIRNGHLPAKEQRWVRDETYLQWDWSEGWEDTAEPEQIQWLEDEILRLYLGAWILINGKPTYLNNYAYFFHQWFVLETGDRPDFRDTSLEFFRFYEICEKHPNCMGMVNIKGRRLGASSMSDCILLLNAILLNENTLQGMVSKSSEDGKELFKILTNAFQSLPIFLKPRISGNESAAKELHVREQPKRINKNTKQSGQVSGLNNRVNFLAPKENAYDGRRTLVLLVDEAGKWEEVDISKYLTVARKCVTKGARVIGTIIMITTVNAPKKGGANFKKVWLASDIDKRNELGQTASGLWRFFIPGYRGYDGYVDYYGNSVVSTPTPEQTEYLKSIGCPNPYVGAKEYTDNLKKMAQDEETLQEEKRLCPSTWQEAFDAANDSCPFNVKDTNAQIEVIEEEMIKLGRDILKGENGRMGWFVKDANDKNIIKFVDDPKGLWYVLELLPPSEANKFIYKGGIKCPANTIYGCAGLDPFANSDKTVDKGSDACLMVRKRYTSLEPDKSGKPAAMFLGKMKTKKEIFEQFMNGVQYYGVELLGERAPTDWIEAFIEAGLASPIDTLRKVGYLITTKRANGSEIYGIAPQDKEAREEHLTVQIESSYSDTSKIGFMRLLKDRLSFDIEDRTDFDACMGDGYALMGMRKYVAPPPPSTETRQFVKTYRIRQ